jgi:hypothetical protein
MDSREMYQPSSEIDAEKRLSHVTASSGSVSASEEQSGFFYQDQLDQKHTRQHFFSPLDPSYAQAVKLDAEKVLFTVEEDYRIKRKIDNRVLPLIICGFLCTIF